MYKTARAGDFFLPLDDVLPNVPDGRQSLGFRQGRLASASPGPTARYTFGYRTDMIDAPIRSSTISGGRRFAGKRATYVTINELQMTLFVTSCAIFGKDQYDIKAGYEAMKKLVPLKTSDFTGNMQALLERGEIVACDQWDGEMWAMEDRGVKVGAIYLGGEEAAAYPDPNHQQIRRADGEETRVRADGSHA